MHKRGEEHAGLQPNLLAVNSMLTTVCSVIEPGPKCFCLKSFIGSKCPTVMKTTTQIAIRSRKQLCFACRVSHQNFRLRWNILYIKLHSYMFIHINTNFIAEREAKQIMSQ